MRRRRISQALAPWKYEELMDFLRHQNSTAEYQIENDEVSVSEEEEKLEIDSNESRHDPVYVSVHKDNYIEDSEEREKRRAENDRRRRGLRNYSIDSIRSSRDNGLKELFSGLCQKTLQLPRHLQLRIQREVFEAVTRAEEEALSLGYSSGYDERSAVIETIDSSQPKTIRIKNEKGKTEDMILIA